MCRFASFYESAAADSTLQYLIAFLVLLSTLKLWRLLRLNPKMNIFTATLQRAWRDITGFLLIIAIMFAAYSIVVSVGSHSGSIFCSHSSIWGINRLGGRPRCFLLPLFNCTPYQKMNWQFSSVQQREAQQIMIYWWPLCFWPKSVLRWLLFPNHSCMPVRQCPTSLSMPTASRTFELL